jgi:hypothetical protein
VATALSAALTQPPLTMPPAPPRIRPLVHLALDAETACLSGAIAYALAGAHPEALPFFGAATVGQPGSGRGPDALVRSALEACTDLGSREHAILRGYEIDDAANVVLSLFLGDAVDTRAIEMVLEAVHRTAGGFFDQTRVDVHALLFLPDLERPEGRRGRYRSAYEQLSLIDDLASPARELGFRGRPSLDYRWIVDCRSHSGAHAGTLDEILSPVALALAQLLHGADADPVLEPDSHSGALRGHVANRVAGYSMLGLALLQHDPLRLARSIGADVAARHLVRYLRSEAVPDAAFFGGYDLGMPSLADDEAERLLAAWTSDVRLGERLTAVRSPAAVGFEGDDDPVRQRRQDRYRDQTIGSVGEQLLERGREWLVQHGVADTKRMLVALAEDGNLVAPDETLVTELSVDGLYRRYAVDLSIALELPQLAERVETLRDSLASLVRDREKLAATIGGLGADVAGRVEQGENAASSASERAELERRLAEIDAARAEKERECSELEAERRRRELLLDRNVPCEVLERELRAIGGPFVLPTAHPPMGRDDRPSVPSPKAGPGERAADAHGTADAAPTRRWWERLLRRPRVVTQRETAGTTPAAGPPAPAVAAPVDANPGHVTAWELVERLRWLQAYASMVRQVLDAVREHGEDVRQAADYFAQAAEGFARQCIRSTKFRLAILRKQDVLAEAATHRAALAGVLVTRFGHERLAACCKLDSEPLAPLQHPLNIRLDGLDEAVTATVDETLAPLMVETLGERCERSQQLGHSPPLPAYLRTLAEAAEPLSRPRDPAGGALVVRRAAFGDAGLRRAVVVDGGPAAIVDKTLAAWSSLSAGTTLTFVTTGHGFPAHAMHKLLATRAELDSGDRPLVDPSADLWPALGMPDSDAWPLERYLVLGRILGLVGDDERGSLVLGIHFPGTLADVAYAIGHSVAHRHIEHDLRRALERALELPDARDRLRRAVAKAGTVESETALEILPVLGESSDPPEWTDDERPPNQGGPDA